MSLIYSAIRRAGDEHGSTHAASTVQGVSSWTPLSSETGLQRVFRMARLRGPLLGIAVAVFAGALFGALYAHGVGVDWRTSSDQSADAGPQVAVESSASVGPVAVSPDFAVSGENIPATVSNERVEETADVQVALADSPPDALHAEADRHENDTPAVMPVKRESVRASEPPNVQANLNAEERLPSPSPAAISKSVEGPVAPPALSGSSTASVRHAQPAPDVKEMSPEIEKVAAVVDIRVARSGTTEPKSVPTLVDAFGQAMGARNFLQAEQILRTLRDALPAQSLTLLRLEAWLALESGELEHAREVYAVILGRDPRDLNAGLNMGLALHRLGRREDAMRQIERLLRDHPGHQAARDFLMFMQKEG